MKKIFTHIFLLGLIILVATGCPDPVNPTSNTPDDFPIGHLYYKDFSETIYRLSLPNYALATVVSNGDSPNKLSDGTLIYIEDVGIKQLSKDYSSSKTLISRDKSNPNAWNGSFKNLKISEKDKLLVYESKSNSNISIVDFQGKLVKEITKINNQAVAYPEFSNDGKLLLNGYNNELGIVEYDWNTEQSKVLIEGSENPKQVSVSPDGSKLAFIRNSALWISDRDGSNEQKITNDSKIRSSPVWSPDSKWVATIVIKSISFIRISDKSEFTMNYITNNLYPGFQGVNGDKIFWVNY